MKVFVSPTVVLTPFRLDDATMSILAPDSRSSATDDAQSMASDRRFFVQATTDAYPGQGFNLPYVFEPRPSGDFAYESSATKLINLGIGENDRAHVSYAVPGEVMGDGDRALDGIDLNVGHQGRLHRLSCFIDLDSQVSVGCAGAVLGYLQRRRSAAFLPGDDQIQTLFHVSTVEMASLQGSMWVSPGRCVRISTDVGRFMDANTLASLQIIQPNFHPHQHNQGPTKSNAGSKEGLSIYGLFHHQAVTPQGRLLLKQYFQRPSNDINVISERLDTISTMLRSENLEVMEDLTKLLRQVKDMRKMTLGLRKGANVCIGGAGKGTNVKGTVWYSMGRFVFNVLTIKDHLQKLVGADRLLIRAKFEQGFNSRNLAQVGRCIEEVVDSGATADLHRTVVKHGVDENLDELKRTYGGLEHLLAQVANDISRRVPQLLDAQVNVIYLPQIGFLIVVRLDTETSSGVWEGSGNDRWERIFTAETTAYYKNEQTYEMDTYLGDIAGRICGELDLVATVVPD